MNQNLSGIAGVSAFWGVKPMGLGAWVKSRIDKKGFSIGDLISLLAGKYTHVQ